MTMVSLEEFQEDADVGKDAVTIQFI